MAHVTSRQAGGAGFDDALRFVDERLRRAVAPFREELAERARDPFRGLYVSDADVDALLDAPVLSVDTSARATGSDAAERLRYLAERFGLDGLDRQILLTALAPELEPRYERLYGYLHDDVTRRRPSVELTLRLLVDSFEDRLAARRHFHPDSALFRHCVLEFADDAGATTLLSRPFRVADRIVAFLTGDDRIDDRLHGIVQVIEPMPACVDGAAPRDDVDRLASLLGPRATVTNGPLVYVREPRPGLADPVAFDACRSVGRAMLVVNASDLLADGSPSDLIPVVTREAVLQRAVLAISGFDRFLADEPGVARARDVLRRQLLDRRDVTVFVGEYRWEPAEWIPDATTTVIELSGRQREAARRGAGPLDHAGAIGSPRLDGLAHQVEPRYGWDDIVLTRDNRAQLAELCARVRHEQQVLGDWGFGRKHVRRSGLTALFVGPPGTGKTMAAEVIASTLGLELFRIDLAAIVSKYIGETEKNLERIFRAADRGNALLLFDEADALFGKRSETRDAHDRYANVEVAYLLQRLETYEGLAILTTNLRGNVDEAFLRRLDFVVEFPLPEEAERLAIWRRAFPSEAPRGDDVDLAFLARKFRLAGGHIRNVALAAAFLAASEDSSISMRHLVRAMRREHQKLGKLIGDADFERYGGLLGDG